MKKILPMLSVIILLVACDKVSYHKTTGGMPYQHFKGKDTQRIYAGSYVKANIIYKVKDSVYFSSVGKLPVYLPVSQTPNPYDISEIWTSLNVGDSVVATQMMDTFIKRSPMSIPPEFHNGDRIVTYVKVLGAFSSDSLSNADETIEKKAFLSKEISFVEKYLADKNLKTQKTTSGAFVEILNPGTGNLPDSGKFVTVNYTGSTFSGKKFDSNVDTSFHHTEPLNYMVSTHQMIQGFDEAILLMKPGGSARVYVPSMLGYGANPRPGSGIKPFEHLIFDLTLLNVSDKATPVKRPAATPNQKLDAAQPKK